MKIGVVGDCHFSLYPPIRRKDDYLNTLCKKFSQAIAIFEDQKCAVIVQVGDLVDSPCVGNKVKSSIIKILKKTSIPFLMICGQHDIIGHNISTFESSPLSVFYAAEIINILTSDPFTIDNINFYGVSYGQEIVKPKTKGINILVIHQNIGEPLFPGHNIISPKQFLQKHYYYDIILCGDYHNKFIARINNRIILNPGIIIRKTKKEFDYKPSVAIIDTENLSINEFLLTIEPPEQVFTDFSYEQTSTKNIQEFINKLKKTISDTYISEQILNEVKSKYSEKVQKLIDRLILEGKNVNN